MLRLGKRVQAEMKTIASSLEYVTKVKIGIVTTMITIILMTIMYDTI